MTMKVFEKDIDVTGTLFPATISISPNVANHKKVTFDMKPNGSDDILRCYTYGSHANDLLAYVSSLGKISAIDIEVSGWLAHKKAAEKGHTVNFVIIDTVNYLN